MNGLEWIVHKGQLVLTPKGAIDKLPLTPYQVMSCLVVRPSEASLWQLTFSTFLFYTFIIYLY